MRSRRPTALCVWLLAVAGMVWVQGGIVWAQEAAPLPTRDDAWISARDTMRGALRRLENLTCIQNIRREAQRTGGPGRRSGPTEDFVRLQVSTMDGKEYYSYPGDEQAVTEPHLLIKTGMTGTGLFFGYARTIFEKHPFTTLQLVGREQWQGRPALRFRFAFDQIRERLNITRAGGNASVAAGGEFLVDEADFLLRQMLIRSADPAPELGIKLVEYDLRWSILQSATASPGSTPLVIPERAEMRMLLFNGEVQRNEIHLTQCQEFRVETALRFDDEEGPEFPAESGAAALAAPEPAAAPAFRRLTGPAVLPAGLDLPLQLEASINLREAAIGDALVARLARAVPLPDGSSLPQGSLAELRIRRLERIPEPEPHAVVWIELSTLRAGATVYLGLAQLERRDRVRGMVDRLEVKAAGRATAISNLGLGTLGQAGDVVVEEVIYPSIPGVGAFLFRGEPGVLPQGYPMTWRTLPPRSGAN